LCLDIPNINIILGCFGRSDDGFVSCKSIENVILTLDPKHPSYNSIMDYLEQCQLFDKSILEYNAIRHFVINLGARFNSISKPLWSEKKYKLYQKFVIDHRDCGCFVKLKLDE